MINLTQEIYYEYIDDVTVEIFNQYKWALSRLGINFDQEILEKIVYCSSNLEGCFQAFCGWVLRLQENGEKLGKETLRETLLKALKENWQPTDFQKQIIKKYQYLFTESQYFFWEKAKEILGYALREELIADILENGIIIYRENINLNNLSPENLEKLTNFKNYLSDFRD